MMMLKVVYEVYYIQDADWVLFILFVLFVLFTLPVLCVREQLFFVDEIFVALAATEVQHDVAVVFLPNTKNEARKTKNEKRKTKNEKRSTKNEQVLHI